MMRETERGSERRGKDAERRGDDARDGEWMREVMRVF